MTGLLAALAPFFLLRASSSPRRARRRACAWRLARCAAASVFGLSAEGRTTIGPLTGSGFLATDGSARLRRRLGRLRPSVRGCGGALRGLRCGLRARWASSSALLARLGLGAFLGNLQRAAARIELVGGQAAGPTAASTSARRSASTRRCARRLRRATEMVRFFFFSTTTDFDRPWLKLCRTWPDSTVRFKLSGLRGATLQGLISRLFRLAHARPVLAELRRPPGPRPAGSA